jgi:hypothetical protein
MNASAIPTRQTKTHYSEVEAAQELGVTVEQLRVLIRNHIAKSDEDLAHIAIATFHASDLLVLKILTGQHTSLVASSESE